ncbi:MAG: GTPase [Candidatus Accumulibacter sp.]|jgi:hypothetical protein|nr:GTPase [Accumulibacter sp.]
MDHAAIDAQMQKLASAFIPRNCRKFTYRIFDDQPKKSAWGFYIDPKPFEGKVVARTDDAIIVKNQGKQSEFSVLDRSLVTPEPGEGARVEVHPYARRRFDGERADTPREETRIGLDGKPYTLQTQVLGEAPAKLPIPEPRCFELRQLIEQLESLPAPDGFRNVTHLLVDAGATDFAWVDPKPADIIKTPPSISFSVSSAKFEGRVTVLYERGLDLYAVELSRDGERVERVDEVCFDDLGQVLERLIDDGEWRRIRVKILTRH